MRIIQVAFAGAAGFACLVASQREAHAAPGAQVFTVIEGRDTTATSDAGREYLVLIGAKLTTIRTIELRDAADADAGPVGPPLLKSATMFVIALPDGLPSGKYDLVLTPARGTALRLHVNVTYGAPPAGTVDDKSLAAPLKQKVDDSNASTLGGLPASSFRDASNLATGTVSPDLYSAIADLVAEGKLGTASDQVAKGDHEHDARYPLKTDLAASGQLNLPTNPVDWSKLKNVPSNFVTGAGEGLVLSSGALALDWSGFAGDLGVSTKAARSDHAHDARYFTQAQLSGAGTLNTGTNPVDWTKLKNVPAGFADGADDTGTAGFGLKLASGVFSADFAGTGLLNTVARSDHDHDSRYFTQSQTSAVGTINLGTNPVDWTKLKGVPSAFADGVDDVGSAGTGLSLAGSTLSVIFGGNGAATSAARSDHNHDSVYAALAHNHDTSYFTQAQLVTPGTLNAASNPLDWTRLKNVPSNVANATTYTAGAGMSLNTGTGQFAVNLGSDGTSNNVARADHAHANNFVSKTGDSMSGSLSVSTSATAPSVSITNSGSGHGVSGFASGQTGGAGCYGLGTIGVLGEAYGGNGTRVGVFGTCAFNAATAGVYAQSVGAADGVPALVANQASTNGGDIARFQRSGTTLVTVNSSGGITTNNGVSAGSVSAGTVSASVNAGGTTAVTGTNSANSNTAVGVRGTGALGVIGTATSIGGGSTTFGVYGESSGNGNSVGVRGISGNGSGYGVEALAQNNNVTAALFAGCVGSADGVPCLVANHSSTNGGDLARFQRNGTNMVTISSGGQINAAGLTAGGVAVSGSMAANINSNSSTTPAVSGRNGDLNDSSNGDGVYGLGRNGVHGVGSWNNGSVGVLGQSNGNFPSTGVIGATYNAAGYGVQAIANAGNNSAALSANCSGSADGVPCIIANHSSTNGGDLALFQRNGSNRARIDVNGKGFFNGGTQASGADFAESVAVVDAREEFEPGDVIVVDRRAKRSFAISTKAESTLVAGVYSTKPALLGTTHDVAADDGNLENEIPLGVVGICPTKVCDEGGPVEIGDLLVTASVKGHAKKAPANPKPGTIVGKALDKLDKGRGIIEVLISLQ